MVAGPEISHLIEQFEKNVNPQSKASNSTGHHEQVPSIQTTFAEETKSLVAAFEELVNPFMNMRSDLLAIHTNDIMPKEVVTTVRNIQRLDLEQCDRYVKEKLVTRSKLITDPHP